MKKATFVLLAVLLLIPSGTPAVAQPQTVPGGLLGRRVEVSVTDQPMADCIASLTAKSGLSILADDAARTPTATVTCSGTARDVLDRIADAFDYDWRLAPSGIVLMVKRFRNPVERPQINEEEISQTSRDLAKVVSRIQCGSDDESWGSMIRALAATFSPGQVRTLQRGGRLEAAGLTPEQLAALDQVILTRAFAYVVSHCRVLLAQVNTLHSSRVVAVQRPSVAAGARHWLCEHVAGAAAGSLVTFLGEFTTQQKEGQP